MKRLLPILFLSVVPLAAIARQEPVTDDAPKAVPGVTAPSFRLNDHRGKLVTSDGEPERWTVLAFFPKAATPG